MTPDSVSVSGRRFLICAAVACVFVAIAGSALPVLTM